MNSSWKEWLLTLFFPHKCFLCGRVLQGDAWLCSDCILPMAEDVCPRCGKAWDACICGRVGYDGASVLLWYQDDVRRGIHRFKYEGRTYYGKFLSRLLSVRIREDLGRIPFDLVTYVPMHRRKQRARGYSQSKILAQEIAGCLDLPVEETLLHTGNKASQMGQHGIANRRDNAKKSFSTLNRDLQGLRILLVDDVLTTGSTLSCCTDLLKEQGAESVYVAVVATVNKTVASR